MAKAKRERDWLMILVGYWHGLRVNEICGGWRIRRIKLKAPKGKKAKIKREPYYHPGITPDDIRDGYLTVERAKGSKRTVQALVSHPDPLLSERDALIELAEKTPVDQRIFKVSRQHFWYLIQRYARSAGVPEHKAHPHILKHSIAMQMIDKAGIHKVKQRLGHESISSTGAYLKETDAAVDSVIVDAVEL